MILKEINITGTPCIMCVQYRGGYHDKCGGYLEYSWGYHEYRGGNHDARGGYHPLKFEYRGGYHEHRGGCSVTWGTQITTDSPPPHGTEHPPQYS